MKPKSTISKNARLPKEYPKGSGIRISVIENRTQGKSFGSSYRVTVPASKTGTGKAEQKSMKTLAKAEGFALKKHSALLKGGFQAENLPSATREDAAKARQLLDNARLQDVTLTEAAQELIRVRQRVGGTLSVTDAALRYVSDKEQQGLRVRTMRDIRQLATLLSDSFGSSNLGELSATDFGDWFAGVAQKRGWAPSTMRRSRNQLSVFWNWAVKHKLAEGNLANGLETPRIVKKPPAILGIDEVGKLLEAAREPKHNKMLPYLVLGLFAGIRAEEIPQLRWDHVQLDREDPLIDVPAEVAKTGEHRVVELEPNAVAWLKSCQQDEGPVTPGKVERRFRKLVIDAGWADEEGKSTWGKQCHNALRHSFASYTYVYHNYNRDLVMERLGHIRDIGMFFSHYRARVAPQAATAYFDLMPSDLAE